MNIAQIGNREVTIEQLQAVFEHIRFVKLPPGVSQDPQLLGFYNGERVQLIIEPVLYYQLYSKYHFDRVLP